MCPPSTPKKRDEITEKKSGNYSNKEPSAKHKKTSEAGKFPFTKTSFLSARMADLRKFWSPSKGAEAIPSTAEPEGPQTRTRRVQSIRWSPETPLRQ